MKKTTARFGQLLRFGRLLWPPARKRNGPILEEVPVDKEESIRKEVSKGESKEGS